MRIYENILKTGENRELPRSYYIPRGFGIPAALTGNGIFAILPGISMYRTYLPKSKNGTGSGFLPRWQILGYEDPNYTNINYPFPVDPPYVPDDNPCGVYSREFELRKKWGRVYIVFEGVSSCAFFT